MQVLSYSEFFTYMQKKDMLQDELTKFADDWSKSTIQKELADTEREIAKYEKQIRAHDADMLNLHINNLPDITEKKGGLLCN